MGRVTYRSHRHVINETSIAANPRKYWMETNWRTPSSGGRRSPSPGTSVTQKTDIYTRLGTNLSSGK